MASAAQDIIDYLEKETSSDNSFELGNIFDNNKVELSTSHLQQFILGICHDMPSGSGFSHYEYRMREKLEAISGKYKCLPWPYEEHDMQEMKIALKGVAEYLKIDMDIENMFKSAPNRRDSRRAYIVVTIVDYTIIKAVN